MADRQGVLVDERERSRLTDGGEPAEAEGEQDPLLDPGVDAPATLRVACGGADLPVLERAEEPPDRVPRVAAVLGLDGRAELREVGLEADDVGGGHARPPSRSCASLT